MVDSLKALEPKRPIREAEVVQRASLDHTVCAKERQGWNHETQGTRGLEIDHQ